MVNYVSTPSTFPIEYPPYPNICFSLTVTHTRHDLHTLQVFYLTCMWYTALVLANVLSSTTLKISSPAALQYLVLEKRLGMANMYKWPIYVNANIYLCRVSSPATAGCKSLMQSGDATSLEFLVPHAGELPWRFIQTQSTL